MSEITRIEQGGILRRQAAKRHARAAGGACLVGFSLFMAGFLAFASHVGQLQPATAIKPADGIVVLTGGQSRIDAGIGLLKAGKGKRLLISGVNPAARVDDLRHATGSERSLFSCCVDIDRVALNTVGNAEESAKWANLNTFGSIIVVTNNYHMPRSLLEMRRILPKTELYPYPVVNNPLTVTSWVTDPNALRVLMTEYAKYTAAIARGFFLKTNEPSRDELKNAIVSK